MTINPFECNLCGEIVPYGTDILSHRCYVVGRRCATCPKIFVSHLDFVLHSAYVCPPTMEERDSVQLQSVSKSNSKTQGQELGSQFCGLQSLGIQWGIRDKRNFRMYMLGIRGTKFRCKHCNKMFQSFNRLSVWKLHSKTCGKKPCGHSGGREGRQSTPGNETQLLPPSVPRPGPSPAVGDTQTNGVGGNSSTNHTFESPQAGAGMLRLPPVLQVPVSDSGKVYDLPDGTKTYGRPEELQIAGDNTVLRWTCGGICTSRDTSVIMMPAHSGAGEAAPTRNTVICTNIKSGETPTTEPSVLNQQQQTSAPELMSAPTLNDALQTTLSELVRDSLPREQDEEAL